jgi:hypothetical protein
MLVLAAAAAGAGFIAADLWSGAQRALRRAAGLRERRRCVAKNE